jgi:hypothetical protein
MLSVVSVSTLSEFMGEVIQQCDCHVFVHRLRIFLSGSKTVEVLVQNVECMELTSTHPVRVTLAQGQIYPLSCIYLFI